MAWFQCKNQSRSLPLILRNMSTVKATTAITANKGSVANVVAEVEASTKVVIVVKFC